MADLTATDTDVFAAVNECVDVRCASRAGMVMHKGPAGFEPLGTLPTTEKVHAIVARSNTEVIVSAETTVYLWDGDRVDHRARGRVAGADPRHDVVRHVAVGRG